MFLVWGFEKFLLKWVIVGMDLSLREVVFSLCDGLGEEVIGDVCRGVWCLGIVVLVVCGVF